MTKINIVGRAYGIWLVLGEATTWMNLNVTAPSPNSSFH